MAFSAYWPKIRLGFGAVYGLLSLCTVY
nr:hypothetical protein [Vibrio pectenicida]